MQLLVMGTNVSFLSTMMTSGVRAARDTFFFLKLFDTLVTCAACRVVCATLETKIVLSLVFEVDAL